MICPKCGTNNEDDSIFCVNCDTLLLSLEMMSSTEPQEHAVDIPKEESEDTSSPAQEPAPRKRTRSGSKKKKSLRNNRLLMGCLTVALILLVTICVVIGVSSGDNGYIDQENSYGAYIDDGHVAIIYNDKLVETSIKASKILSDASCIDGSVYAFLTGDKTLCVVRGKRVTVVADDVLSYTLSTTGKGIVYKTSGEQNALYLCNTKTGKSKLVDDDYSGTDFCISPDGNAVLYNDRNGREASLKYYRNKRTTQISDQNLFPAGLSDKGKYIYAYGMNDKLEKELYRYNTKGQAETLGTIPISVTYFFNYDHTQILFHGKDGKTYIAADGKDASAVSHVSVELLLTANASTEGHTYPVEDLYGHVYAGYDGSKNYSAWFIHKKANKSCNLMSRIHEPMLDSSAEYLYFRRDGDLYCLQISKMNNAAIKAKRIAFDVGDWVVTSDRSRVYYIADGVLYSANGKNGNNRRVVASEGLYPDLVISKRDVVFYIQNDVAYACSNGKRSTEVLTNAKSLETTNGLVYLITGDLEIYVSSGGKKLTLLLDPA